MDTAYRNAGGANPCHAPFAGVRYIPGTGTTVWRELQCARPAWSVLPAGTSPGSAAARREGGRQTVTLYELSQQYRLTAETLRERIRLVETERELETDEDVRRLLDYRLRLLRSMWRDTRAASLHMEHYYERGVCRNENYIIR